MAVLTVVNRFKYELGIAGVNFSTNTFKLALMKPAFTIDQDNHGEWDDISSSEIASTGGYAAGNLVVEQAWVQDNVNDRAYIEWGNFTFYAVGADMAQFGSAIVYVDTHVDKVIMGCIQFDSPVIVTDGNSFQIQDLGYDES